LQVTDAATTPAGIRDDKGVYVTMRDGVRIALRIYRPEGEGSYPCLFAASPYQWQYDDLPDHAFFPWKETGPIQWYVEQGYAYVHADARGTGHSEGTFRYLDLEEQLDYCEILRWIARQEWCTGKIGGIGQSYYGLAQWMIATHRPPELACIAPYDAQVDPYRDAVYHGGILCAFRADWGTTVRANTFHRPANLPGGRVLEYDLNFELLTRPTYDSWWRERSPFERLDQIEIPVLSIGHWAKMGLHLRGNIIGFEQVRGPKKLVVTGAKSVREAHGLFDTIEFHERELLPFYDMHLKGKKNGFMDEPPVRLYVRGADIYREEDEWPPRRAVLQPWYLTSGPSGSVTSINDGGLSQTPPVEDDSSVSYDYPDPEWSNGVVCMGPHGPDPVRRVLTFTSAPLESECEIMGPIVLELYASSDQIDMEIIVKLSEQKAQSPEERESGRQPTYVIASKGWLKASHRELDERRTTPQRPLYTHTSPQPIEPGRVYKFDIEVLPVAYRFAKGSRIRLEIVNGDSPVTDPYFSHLYLPWKCGRDTIWHDRLHPSRILLPVV
jgi:putative CocE/NonD family hydrolase